MDAFLPPPAGVESIRAWQDAPSGTWYTDRLPLVCIKVIGDEFDAMNLDGDWLHSCDRALVLADGRVVSPGCSIYDSVDDWLVEVKKINAEFGERRD
jgi:hypothetical protein